MTLVRAGAGAVAVALLTALSAAPDAAAAGSAAPPALPDCGEGVLVVVDRGDGTGRAACTPRDPGSGDEALELVGVSSARNAAGMVCRLDDVPQDCPASPPMDRYWSYWHAGDAADPEWAYAVSGSATHDPAPGSIEGWRLGDGEAPPDLSAAWVTGGDGPLVSGEAAGADTRAADSGPWPTVITLGGLAALAVALGAWQWSRRRG